MKKTSAGKIAKYIKLAIKLTMLATAPATLTNCPPPVGPEVPPVNPPTQPTTPHEHEFGGAYIADGANGHYQLCQIDHTTRSAVEPHAPGEWITDSEPAMGRPGSKHIECTVCGYEMQREQIAEIPHNFGGAYISDGANGHYQLCQTDHVTRSPIQSHQLNWTTVKPIINYADGLERGICAQCGYEQERALSPYVAPAVENIYFSSNTISNATTVSSALRVGKTKLSNQASAIDSQYYPVTYGTFAYNVTNALANFAANMNGAGSEVLFIGDITNYNSAVIPAIKNLFSNTADAALFEKRLNAFRLAHYTNQRQFNDGSGRDLAPSIESKLTDLNTLCAQVNISGVTGTTIKKDNINAAIGTILLTLKETLPYDKAGAPGLNLLQQFEDTAQFEALIDDIKAKGLAADITVSVPQKLQQNTVNPVLEQEENLYYVEERRKLQEAAGLYV